MSHEVMHDVTTETLVPAGVTERDGAAPGAARVAVGVGPVSRASVVAVARDGAGVELTVEAEEAIGASRAVVEALADDPVPHYGVSTGFGALANTAHPAGLRAAAAAQPGALARRRRRAPRSSGRSSARMMLLRLSTLATGRTGVRLGDRRGYAALLNAGITPVVRGVRLAGLLGRPGAAGRLSRWR